MDIKFFKLELYVKMWIGGRQLFLKCRGLQARCNASVYEQSVAVYET